MGSGQPIFFVINMLDYAKRHPGEHVSLTYRQLPAKRSITAGSTALPDILLIITTRLIFYLQFISNNKNINQLALTTLLYQLYLIDLE